MMIGYRDCGIAALAIAAFVLAACATSNFVSGSWKDSDYHRKIGKVLVVGLSKNQTRRRTFEDTLVEQFHRIGIAAVPSYRLVPLHEPLNKEAVRQEVKMAIQGKNFDTVLVSHLIGVDKSTTYVPPSTHLEYGFYRNIVTAYSIVYTPGYLEHDTVVSLETNLYDTASEKLIWSMTSHSFNPADAMDVIKPLSRTIIKDLSAQGLV